MLYRAPRVLFHENFCNFFAIKVKLQESHKFYDKLFQN